MRYTPTKETIEMREVYAQTLVDLAKRDGKLVALEADLSSSIKTDSIKEQLGDRLINLGIMEAEMIGAAAGLSVTGFKPFVHTFANFATRRVYDQVFVSLAYAQLNAVILGSDAGVTAEANGGTHMPFEDIALMRIIPNATVYEASDSNMLRVLLEKAYNNNGLTYIRTTRKAADKLYEKDTTFDDGTKLLKDGKDLTIFASGIMVSESLIAAAALSQEGIEAKVIDVYQLKPLNKETIISGAETGAVITVENHNIIGGLGSAIAEVLSENKPTLQVRVGIDERFGQVGKTDWLKEDYGITAEHIVQKAKELIAKKTFAV